MKYRDPIIEATGKLPFSGKHIAKYLFQKGKEGSENGEYMKKVVSSGALALFGFLHYSQLKMGITELAHADYQNAAEVAIDLGYTVANGMVVYTQTMLAGAAFFTSKKEEKIESYDPTPEYAYAGAESSFDSEVYNEVDTLESSDLKKSIKFGQVTLTELAVTLGGQILFMSTKYHGH